MLERTFHLSVIKWLSDRNYKFWWELTLPYCRLRPDFLAIAPDGEKMILECKVDRSRAHRALVSIPDYVAALNEQTVHTYLTIPDSLYLPPKFMLDFETPYIHILRIPETPTADNLGLCQHYSEAAKYFSVFMGAPKVLRTDDNERLKSILGKAA